MRESWIDEDVHALDKREGIGAVVGWLRGEARRPPVLMDGVRPFGLVNGRLLLSRRWPHGTRAWKVAWPVPVLDEGVGEDVVVGELAKTRAPYLPVVGRRGGVKRLVGVVRAERVLEDYFEGGPRAGAFEVFVPPLRGSDSLAVAVRRLAAVNVDALPVVDVRHRVVGVVLASSLLRLRDFVKQPRLRSDRSGEAWETLRESVAGHVEEAWGEVGAAASFEKARGVVLERGHAVVVDGRRSPLGVLDASSMIRGALEFGRPAPLAPSQVRSHFRQVARPVAT